MKPNNNWSKTELQIYILLLCANADNDETKSEIKLIKSKTDAKTFRKIYKEFSNDSEDESYQKIDASIQTHDYSHMELSDFRKEMLEVFNSDNNFSIMEHNLNKIMDNMLY